MLSTTTPRLDLRDIAPRQRHALVFDRIDALAVGEALELVNDHDPQPLRHQLQQRAPGALGWTVLQAGPDEWRVRIARLQALGVPVEAGNCCSGGACCG